MKLDGEDAGQAAFLAQCAHCKTPIEVSVFCAEIAEKANGICRQKGWAEIGPNEMALCTPCYGKHRDRLALEAEKELELERQSWDWFTQGWPAASAEKRAEAERRWCTAFPHQRTKMREWVAKQKAQPGARATDAATGFGKRRRKENRP